MVVELTEKPYEMAFAREISGHFQATDQVIEKTLGYDAFGNVPATDPVWGILGFFPQGVRLQAHHWRGAPAQPDQNHPSWPTRATNLLLQFKRPEYMILDTAGQWGLWKKPYYRFKITNAVQQQTLSALDRELSKRNRAVVRYASPAFYTYKDLTKYTLATKVVTMSNFVEPSKLDGHKVWTYVDQGTYGQANPGKEIEGPSIYGLLQEGMTYPREALESVIEVGTEYLLGGGIWDVWDSRVYDRGGVADHAPRRPREAILKSLHEEWEPLGEYFEGVLLHARESELRTYDANLVMRTLRLNHFLDRLNVNWTLVFSD